MTESHPSRPEEAVILQPPAKILVVEDDISLLHGIRSILQLDHYDVLIAKNGQEALEIMHKEAVPPDLIISDIMMPLMDGNQLLREVRKVTRWLEIPFIFLTARSGRDDIQEGVALGADDYITKPYDPEYLRVTVRSKLLRKENLDRLHAENIEELKHSILTILNHEFRTPLTFVVAYADMLDISADLNQLEDNREVISYLKGISSGAERLRKLIENFITLVEMETGEAQSAVEMRKTAIGDIYSLLDQTRVGVLGEDADRCEIVVEDDLPPFKADQEYLCHAMRHLLENAVKFSEPGTPITVRVQHEDGQIIISVQDEGRGIPPEEIPKIWDMFYQVRRDFYEDQGSGSGLAIVKGLVEMHGGRVDVESTLEEGSTFYVRLPVT